MPSEPHYLSREMIPPFAFSDGRNGSGTSGFRRNGVGSRVHGLFIVVALTITAAMGQEGVAQTSACDYVTSDTVLSNGLTVIAVSAPAIPVATIELSFRNGSFTQLELYEEGLPHLMEHMLFRAFGRGKWSWSSQAGDMDAAYNGTTGVETVTYYLIAPSENLKKGIELLSRLVRSPRFDRNDLDEEKRIVSNELERNASDPNYLLDFHTRMALWGSAFRQKNPAGSLPSVITTTTDVLEDHFQRFYVPNNAALIVTGDILPEEVLAAAQDRFEAWERKDDPFAEFDHPPVPALLRDTIVIVETEVPDVTLAVAWQGHSESDDTREAAAADLFGRIVTQRVSGAYGRLVDSGLFHYLSFTHSRSNHVGPIELVTRTTPENVQAAAAALREEISIMATDGYFTEDELEMAKSGLQVQATYRGESAITLAHELAREWSLGGLDGCTGERAGQVQPGVEEVRGYAARYIADAPNVLVMMVSTSTIDDHNAALVAALDAWERR